MVAIKMVKVANIRRQVLRLFKSSKVAQKSLDMAVGQDGHWRKKPYLISLLVPDLLTKILKAFCSTALHLICKSQSHGDGG